MDVAISYPGAQENVTALDELNAALDKLDISIVDQVESPGKPAAQIRQLKAIKRRKESTQYEQAEMWAGVEHRRECEKIKREQERADLRAVAQWIESTASVQPATLSQNSQAFETRKSRPSLTSEVPPPGDADYGRCFGFWDELETQIILRNREAIALPILQADLATLAILHLGLLRGDAEADYNRKAKDRAKSYASKWVERVMEREGKIDWLLEKNAGKRRKAAEVKLVEQFLIGCAAYITQTVTSA